MIKDRIEQLIKEVGIGGRAFCRSIGQSDSYNKTIGKSIGTDVVNNILNAYPQVNVIWLVTGKGEMFIEPEQAIAADNHPACYINNNYKEMYEEIRKDNKDLRDENRKLRESLLEEMHKNQSLIIENSQLKAKLVQ